LAKLGSRLFNESESESEQKIKILISKFWLETPIIYHKTCKKEGVVPKEVSSQPHRALQKHKQLGYPT
jgi:hypothetical protein